MGYVYYNKSVIKKHLHQRLHRRFARNDETIQQSKSALTGANIVLYGRCFFVQNVLQCVVI